MRQLFLILVLLCTSAPLQAALQASVNRTQLEPEQTLELTLESTLASRDDQLDLTPLEEHFEVLDDRRLSLVSQINGRTVPVTRWVIELRPLRSGFVVIPPLTLRGDQMIDLK